ncbi:MAG: GDYXXLXY domain-containing protein [Candidatus Melainabacteria bacterium]|nr:GDYXXLXY domain-containing protein [Candidatus Melainabacteria bacterium]
MIETKPLEIESVSANPRADAIAIPESSLKFSGNNIRDRIFALIITAQFGALFAFGLPYAQTLAFGKTVTLKCHTYDPRDMLKGDYVAITYDIGSKVDLKAFKPGETAYLTLKKESPCWQPVSASKTLPKSLKEDEATIRVTVNQGLSSITTGIEKYYVAEGAASRINSEDLTAEVALSEDGMPVLKHLLSGGKDVAKQKDQLPDK